VLSSWQRMNELFDKPDLAMVKKVYEAIDHHVTLKGPGQAEIEVNLPLEVGLETIVDAPMSTRRVRRSTRQRGCCEPQERATSRW
jgi:hypothetical protein